MKALSAKFKIVFQNSFQNKGKFITPNAWYMEQVVVLPVLQSCENPLLQKSTLENSHHAATTLAKWALQEPVATISATNLVTTWRKNTVPMFFVANDALRKDEERKKS